ncbi:cytochrome-c peroxidase [Pseudofulvibacter geojedonensis]|uniref:Cytochrome-c peroxidase n=1 Tax=Pseudofulvibacter geojedonensis TaxID=1123758 RepID=A0ABW3I464_9FLAO
MKNNSIYSFIVVLFLLSCGKDDGARYSPTPAPLDIPALFGEKIISPIIPVNNPQTLQGIALGKKLFFDTKLSSDNSVSCATCHLPSASFSDNSQFSTGVNGALGTRNSMPLFNMAWNYDERFFWDGRIFSLEHQAQEPITNTVEMNSAWEDVINKLSLDSEYPTLFQQAFPNEVINQETITKALAQFERTLISANTKFDRYLLGEETLTTSELNGFNVFMDEAKGDCFHCHGSDQNPLWTDNAFHNNGLDATFTDLGLATFTGDPNDNGKFKTPSLRNLVFTAPYMHDGRFATIEEVINHYSEGLQNSPTIDPLMKKVDEGGVQLSAQDKADLKAFLLTLTDTEFINNPNFQQ